MLDFRRAFEPQAIGAGLDHCQSSFVPRRRLSDGSVDGPDIEASGDLKHRCVALVRAKTRRITDRVSAGVLLLACLFLSLSAAIAPAQQQGLEAPRGFIRMTLAEVTAEQATALGWPSPRGVMVTGVKEDGPADRAGVKAGDVVVAVDGVEIDGSEQFLKLMAQRKADEQVRLQVFRGREALVLEARLEGSGVEDRFADLYRTIRASKDPEERIRLIEEAVTMLPKVPAYRSSPEVRYVLYDTLGEDYLNRQIGDQASNVDKGIEALTAAAENVDKAKYLSEWAQLSAKIGATYSTRATGPSAERMDRAAALFEAATEAFEKLADARMAAATQIDLAVALRQSSRRQESAVIDRSIGLLEKAGTVFTREGDPKIWAQQKLALGGAFEDRFRLNRDQADVERSIGAFEAGLSVFDRAAQPAFWASAQNSLAQRLWGRQQGDRASNQERSISAIRAAIEAEPFAASPTNWSNRHGRLATYLRNRLTGERSDNLRESITILETALKSVTRAQHPKEWAALQHELGTSLYTAVRFRSLNRARGFDDADLRRASVAFREALSVRTPDEDLDGSLETLIEQLKVVELTCPRACKANRDAIAAIGNALTKITPQSHRNEWEVLNSALGVFLDRESNGQIAELNVRAQAAHEAALQSMSPDRDVARWLVAKNSYALLVANRADLPKVQRLDQALAILEEALEHPRAAEAKADWANAQQSLGFIFADRIAGDRASNLDAEIRALRSALNVFTLEEAPLQHLKSSSALGSAHLEKKQYRLALDAFESARRAHRILLGQAAYTREMQAAHAEAGVLYLQAAYAAAETGDLEGALEWSMQGKSRLISGMLTTLEMWQSESSAAALRKVGDIYAKLRAATAEVEKASADERNDATVRQTEIMREHREAIAEALRIHAEKQQGPLATLSTALTLVPEDGAIVIQLTSRIGGKLLIVTRNGSRAKLSEVDLPQLGVKDINTLFAGGAEVSLGKGYLGAYALNEQPDDVYEARVGEWLDAIVRIGDELWPALGNKLHRALRSAGVNESARVVWMPSAFFSSAPVGLARHPKTGRRLGDMYELVQAPSLEALAVSAQTSATIAEPTLSLVVNPTGDLPFTLFEGGMVRSHFKPETRQLFGAANATRDAVIDSLKAQTYWHFSTHGKFARPDGLESSLYLKDGETLTLAQLARQTYKRPRLVVLSACESGLAELRPHDESASMPAVFMALGAGGVVGTLWPVDDRATALLISRFYDLHLDRGLSPPTALRKAQSWLRRATNADLLAYVDKARRTPGLDLAAADMLTSSLQTSSHTDARYQRLAAVAAERDRRSSPQAAPNVLGTRARSGKVKPSKTEKAYLAQRPFSHPYYWGAFTYTGL